jgi:hypothetical protein
LQTLKELDYGDYVRIINNFATINIIMFLFHPWHIKRKRCICTESNTKTANVEYKHHFCRSLIYNGVEFKTLSVSEHWHNETGNYYRFGCPAVVSYRISNGELWEECWYVNGKREILIGYDKDGNGMFWPKLCGDGEIYYNCPNILLYSGEFCRTNMLLICKP